MMTSPADTSPVINSNTAASIGAIVFDVGRVLFQWDLRHLFRKLIDDPGELEWFVANVVTEEWHFRHDAGTPLAEMLPERIAAFPQYAAHIRAYGERFNESIPGPVPGSLELVGQLHAAGHPLFAITNFGAEFWHAFHPTQPVFGLFRDIVVSGQERLTKPGRAIYELAARRFGHAPQSMLFIDDSAANVAAARDLGWQVHYFTDAPSLEADLLARRLLA